MKIFYDARFIRTDFHDGISRYSNELLHAVHKLHPVTAIISDKKQLGVIPKGIDFIIANKPTSWRELFIARTLNRHKPDVVFTPMQTMGSWGRHYHLILTLHDMIYYKINRPPSRLPPHVRLAWWLFHLAYWPQRFVLNRADMLVTVSQTSKELIKYHHMTKRPVRVVYNAPSLEHIKRAKETGSPAAQSKNLVYMGWFWAYKNVEMLMQAMFFLPEYTLHCMSPITSKRKKELLALAPPNQVVFHNGVTDKEYAAMLTSAHALVTASIAEGFGLPLVEAMSAGTPVVCSDIPIFHEVAEHGALYFDTNDQTTFAKQVVSLEDPKLRADLIRKGSEQAKQFNWHISAQALLKAMKDLTE
jgi:glycosyltransferase involved in cell wall biosynthesis